MQSFEHASNADLLSALTGPKPAHLLLQQYGGLTQLAKASLDELQHLKGLGKAKAVAIRSAFLLAQRLSAETYAEKPLLDTPERVANVLRESNRLHEVEHFQVAFLNKRHRLMGVQSLAKGTLDTVVIHAREVFAPAISKRASAIILVHNHPSGDPTPSQADIQVTREMIRAGQLLRIEVIDHVIFGASTIERPRDYCSMRDLGYFAANSRQ